MMTEVRAEQGTKACHIRAEISIKSGQIQSSCLLAARHIANRPGWLGGAGKLSLNNCMSFRAKCLPTSQGYMMALARANWHIVIGRRAAMFIANPQFPKKPAGSEDQMLQTQTCSHSRHHSQKEGTHQQGAMQSPS